jgi:hypothetical protein
MLVSSHRLRIDWDDIRQCEITGRETVEIAIIAYYYRIVTSVLVCTRIVPA